MLDEIQQRMSLSPVTFLTLAITGIVLLPPLLRMVSRLFRKYQTLEQTKTTEPKPSNKIKFSQQKWTVTNVLSKRQRNICESIESLFLCIRSIRRKQDGFYADDDLRDENGKVKNYVSYILNIEVHDTHTQQLLHTFQTTQRRYSELSAFFLTFDSIKLTTRAEFPPKTGTLFFYPKKPATVEEVKSRKNQLLLWFNEMLDREIVKGAKRSQGGTSSSVNMSFLTLKVATWLLDKKITKWMEVNMAPASNATSLPAFHIDGTAVVPTCMVVDAVPIKEIVEVTAKAAVPSAPPLDDYKKNL